MMWSFLSAATLLFLSSSSSSAQHTRSGVLKNKVVASDGPSPRVVGGTEAVKDFYTFPVSLVTRSGGHSCGGSIIALNVILTAAHCQGDISFVDVGRHDRNSLSEDYERVSVIREIPHPDYREGRTRRYDQMILILDEDVTQGSPITINRSDNSPRSGANVTSMGWGRTDPDDDKSTSPILLEVQMTVLSNSDCEDSKSPSYPLYNYRGAISDDMVCAYESGRDTCQGDSGGPLITATESGALMQIGVVSWGIGCAQELLPGVYSRTSYDSEWIDSLVCEYANNAPADFGCDGSGGGTTPVASPVAPPTRAPVAPVARPVESLLATLNIQMDAYPEEVGWRIERIGVTTETVASRTPGYYRGKVSQMVQEQFFLEDGEPYEFLIFDIEGDGICCGVWGDGSYQMLLEDRIVFSEDGDFNGGTSNTFIASVTGSGGTPALTPLETGDSFLELEIQFDEFPEEISWVLKTDSNTLSSQGSEVVAFKPARSYTTELANQRIVETIPVVGGREFTFHFLDIFADGLCCDYGNGFYRLFEGSVDAGNLLREGNLEGSARESTTFTVSGEAVPTVPTVPPAPTISPAPTSPLSNVEIRIQPDGFPQDIGWKIEDSQGQTVKSVRSGTYTTPAEILETVYVESNSVLKFTIFDELENGICCNDGQGFYSVSTAQGMVGSGGTFRASDEVVFTTDAGDVPVQLTIGTDTYPEETSWQVERLDLHDVATVAMAPKETYTSPREAIEASITVAQGGFYRFTVRDSNADGICCDYGEGSIALAVDGTEVSSDPGSFRSAAYFHFYAGGDLPTISNPRILTLQLKFDKYPQEFAWVILQSEVDTTTSDPRAIRRDRMKIVGYSPISYNQDMGQKTIEVEIHVEQIPSGVTRDFTLLTFDTAGDGLCCRYGEGGYTLYDGANSTSTVIVSGTGTGSDQERTNFTLSQATMAPTKPPTSRRTRAPIPTPLPIPTPPISANGECLAAAGCFTFPGLGCICRNRNDDGSDEARFDGANDEASRDDTIISAIGDRSSREERDRERWEQRRPPLDQRPQGDPFD